jgi:G3E family GTPase
MLDLFLELLRSTHGPNLLRMKAIVNIEETPDRPMVLHGVQHVLHPRNTTRRLAGRRSSYPHGVHRPRHRTARHSGIVRRLPRLHHAAPDRPDAQALADNPLVPFGGLDR